jgi:cell division protein FtsN
VELAIYVKKLLYNHDILVIPGLGGLITQYKPAEINETNHSIAPPSKFLTFDKNLTDTDGLLANYISIQKNISRESAEEFIFTEVQSILKRLDEKETILFEGIGYFSKEAEVIRFDREAEANFLTDSFGLSSVDYEPVEVKLTPKKNPETIKTYKAPNYSKILIFIGVMVVMGAAIYTYLYFPNIAAKLKHNRKTISEVTSPVKKTMDTIVTKKDTLSKNKSQSSELEKFFDSATDKKKALALSSASKAEKPETNVTFYLIAGSFKTYDRAQILAKALTKEGYKPEIIQFEQDKYRVSLGEFKNKVEAQSQLDHILAVKGADAVWMLKK